MDSKFSDDMTMEILSRTSLNTLDALRCTSKQLGTLTYDPYFLNLYKKNKKIVSGFLVLKGRRGCDYTNEFAPAPESTTLDLGFLPHASKILASSEQGLIVLESRVYPLVRYHVCKPATKQVLALPNPKTKYMTETVAMVVMSSKPLHYKIIRFSKPRPDNKYVEYTTYRCEIFDSRTWAWRLLDLVRLPSYFSPSDKHPIITRGSIYMLLQNKEVFKFDAYSEKWTTFSSPIQTLDYDLHVPAAARKLVKYQGKLGFACQTPSLRSWEIWVLTVDKSWEQLQVVDMKEVRLNSLEAIYDSNTRVAWEQTTLVFYKFKGDDCISEFQMFQGGYFPCRTFAFGSDFEPVDLRG
ncbi:hypothetical protein L1887_18696 [Cichorium endivia]|nr:hypothetical protein L1887_18696 [Cichorium endivia]